MTSRPPSRPITDFFRPFSHSQHNREVASDNSNSDTKRQPWPSPNIAKRSSETSEIERKTSSSDKKSQTNISEAQDEGRKKTGEKKQGELEGVVQHERQKGSTGLDATYLELRYSNHISILPGETARASAETSRKSGYRGDGEQKYRVIRSSDTEEDGCSSGIDSDSSLEDLTVILSRGENSATSKSHSGVNRGNDTNVSGNGDRRSTRLRKIQSSRIAEKKGRSVSAVPKADYKFSLGSLLDKASEEESAQARLAAIKTRIDAISRSQSKKTLSRKAREIDEKLLASVVTDDEGEDNGERAQRVLQAMERTDALRMDCVWHFFADGWTSPPSSPFPSYALPDAGWQSVLKVPAKREAAFLSGFVETMCLRKSLPVDVISWICDEVCTESHEDLSYAYLGVLEATQEDLEGIITPSWLDQILVNRLGARDKAIAIDQKLAMQVQTFGVSKRDISSGLDAFLNLLIRISPSVSEDCIFHAMQILIRLSVDDSILSSSSHQHLIRHCLSMLVNSLEQSSLDTILDELSQKIYRTFNSNVMSTHLQHSLISRFLLLLQPINISSTILLSRRLALAFFLSSSLPLSLPLSQLGPKLLSAIEQRLERMRVTITVGSRRANESGSNAAAIAAASNDKEDWDIVSKIGLLDIGIGAGLEVVPPGNEKGDENPILNKVNNDDSDKDSNKIDNNKNNIDSDSSKTKVSNTPNPPSLNSNPKADPKAKSFFKSHPPTSSMRQPSSHSQPHQQQHPSQSGTTNPTTTPTMSLNLNTIVRSLARLSASLSSAASGISSMSANHVQRTEAKAALDRLIYRLEYACGAGNKRRGKGVTIRGINIGVGDEDDEEDEGGEEKVFMERFLGL